MKTLILFFKGLIIGIGKVIPGVSGSLLAISLGVYEEILFRIQNFFKSFKENVKFLFPLGIGILVAVLLGSKVLLYFFETFYIYTVVFFIGLIVGTVPNILQNSKRSFKDWIIIFLIFLGMYFFYTKLELPEFVLDYSLFSFLYVVFLGFVDAVTMVMPGISGTATYMMLGSYTFILNLFANPFSKIGLCILFGIGLVFGVLLMIRFVNYCFLKHKNMTWNVIFAFLLSSIFFLFLKIIDLINSSNIFSLFLLFIIGFFLISLTNKD